MESIVTKISSYIASAFGNSATGPKIGGVGGIGFGLVAGLLTGDWVVGGLAMGVGLLVAPFINNTIGTTAAAAVPASAATPPRIEPTVQPAASEKVKLNVGGAEFTVNLPNSDALKKPWGSEGSAAYVAKMADDTRRLVESPESKDQSLDLVQTTLKARNQPFYDYLRTVLQFETEYKKYNDEVRPQWMKQLRLDDSKVLAAMSAPPAFTEKLDLKLSDFMVADTKAGLGISNEGWNRLDNVTRLSRMEEYANKRMVEVSTHYAKLRAEMEDHDRKIPRDFSFAAAGDNLNWATFGIFGKTSGTQMSEAISEFLNDNTDTKEAEDRFRAKMEAVITQSVSKGVIGGEKAAEQTRQLTSLIIEEHKATLQFNSVRVTKGIWASQAERWVKETGTFRKKITDYTAQYAKGAGASPNFVIVQQASIPLIVNNDARKQAEELAKAQQESRAALLKAKDGVHALFGKLKFNEEKVAFDAMPLLDMEKDIKALPASWDIRRTAADSKDLLLRSDLEYQAQRYNDAVTKYRADKSAENKAMLSVMRGHLSEETAKYLEGALHWYESAQKLRDKDREDVAKKTNAGTTLEGVEGIRFFVVDKRPGKSQTFALDGIKKNGKVIITGWSRLTADEKLGARHWLGANMLDTDKGLEFDPVTLKGLDKIIGKTEAAPLAIAEPTPVAVASNENFLAEALKAVGFKAMADTGSYVLPGLRALTPAAKVA